MTAGVNPAARGGVFGVRVKMEGWRVGEGAAAVAGRKAAANAPWRGGVETLKS